MSLQKAKLKKDVIFRVYWSHTHAHTGGTKRTEWASKKSPWSCEGKVLRLIGKKLECRGLGFRWCDSDTLYACMNTKNKFTYFCCCCSEMSLMSANCCFQTCAYCSAVCIWGLCWVPTRHFSWLPFSVLGKQRSGGRQPGLASTGDSAFFFLSPGEGDYFVCLWRPRSWLRQKPCEQVSVRVLSLSAVP